LSCTECLKDNGKLTIGDVQDVRKAGGRDAFTEALADMFGDEEDDGLTLVESQHWLDRVLYHIEAADKLFPGAERGKEMYKAFSKVRKVLRGEMRLETAPDDEEDDEEEPFDTGGMSSGSGYLKGTKLKPHDPGGHLDGGVSVATEARIPIANQAMAFSVARFEFSASIAR
jgi:hypothetical protein